MRRTGLAVAAIVGLGVTAARAADTAAQLAGACVACHRLDGQDSGIPAIVGRPEADIVSAMTAYRAGARPSQIMRVVANALTPAEIVAIAHYLSQQAPEAVDP